MGKPLKMRVLLEVLGHEIDLEVTTGAIAILEDVYDAALDVVIQWELGNPLRVKRSKVAECIARWIALQNKMPEGVRRREVLDYVMGASETELNVFSGAIQAAALYCTRDAEGAPRITPEQFAELVAGRPIDLGKKKGEGDGEKKDQAPEPSSEQSTTSPSAPGA